MSGGLEQHQLLTMAELAEVHDHYPGWLSILRETNISPDAAQYFVMPGRLCETESFVKQQLALLRQREPPWFQAGRRPPRLPPIKHQQLSAAQAMAVQGLLSHSLAVLTGGPGVGKTSLIRNLIHCLDEEYAACPREPCFFTAAMIRHDFFLDLSRFVYRRSNDAAP